MKKRGDKIIFILFTIPLLILLYLFFFQKELYYIYMNKFFNKDNENNIKYDTLLYSYIFYYISYFVFAPYCKKSIYNISKIYYKNYEQRRLHDLFHNIIPYNKYSGILSEILSLIIVLSILIIFILNPNAEFLYSVFIFLGIMVILKCITGLMTLLPDASGICTYSNFFESCNDLLFSGHSAKILILLLLCDYYNIISNYMLNIYYILFGIMIILILSSRKHYSIDIFFAIIIALFIFMIYYNKDLFVNKNN